MQVTIRSESPLYKTEGNDFYMNYDGGSSITLTAGPIYTREDSTTRKEDIDIRTEIAKIYNDFGLAKTDARGLMKETDIYTGKGLICSVQSPSVNIDITPRTYANCGIVSAYEDFAPTIKEFSKIIPNNTDAPFFSNPKISSSPVSGYQKATVSVGGVNSLGGAAALLYKKDSKPWVYFTSTQGIIPCSAYNTSDLISAFNGDRCYDANDTEATVK